MFTNLAMVNGGPPLISMNKHGNLTVLKCRLLVKNKDGIVNTEQWGYGKAVIPDM